MPAVTAEQLLSSLEKGQALPGILLLGTDLYLRDTCRSKLIEASVPAASRPWAVTRLSLEDTTLSHALQQALTMPMLSPRQVIFLSGLDGLMRLGDDNREAAEKQLETYFAAPAPFTVLVLEAEALDQRTKLFKLLSHATLVVEVELVSGKKDDDKRAATIGASQKLIPGMAKELNIVLEPEAVEELAAATNGELARIHTELEKLSTYTEKGQKVTAQDVDLLVVSGQKSSVWKLADMLAERRGNRALEFMDQLIREGEQPAGLIGGMTWMYRKLLEAQDAPKHLNEWAAAGVLKMRPETAKMALSNARRIPRERLLAGLTALYDADSQLKGGAADPRAVVEFLVGRLTR